MFILLEMKILIWKARTAKGLSLRELAAKTGISKSALQRMETGSEIPNMRHMELIAKNLGVTISSLYESFYK